MHAVTPRRGARAGLLSVALVAAGGCTAGPPPATFTEIYAAVFPLGTPAQCDYCHDRPPNNLSNGMLDMGHDRATAYAALLGVASTSAHCGGHGAQLVVPGHPESSLLYQKLSAAPPCGDRMPQGATPLTDAQLEMVRSWIAAGALDN
jgi:hypothetical protein